jgi:ferric-dicitrate binding protein FerR (iron transport regulator)
MSCEARQEHQNAWRRIEARVRDLAATPKAKVFEVHHAVEHARRLYQSELAKGLPADLCERAVLSAYEVQS